MWQAEVNLQKNRRPSFKKKNGGKIYEFVQKLEEEIIIASIDQRRRDGSVSVSEKVYAAPAGWLPGV